MRCLPAALAALLLLAAARLAAQQPDSAAAPAGTDTARVTRPVPRAGTPPPVSPSGAFARSLLLPGLGQLTLKRKLGTAFFLATEATFVTLVVQRSRQRSAALADSVAFAAAGQADSAVAAGQRAQDRSRQREDWIIATVLNHVVAGAEAYIAASLWDFPGELSVRPTPHGLVIATSIPFRLR